MGLPLLDISLESNSVQTTKVLCKSKYKLLSPVHIFLNIFITVFITVFKHAKEVTCMLVLLLVIPGQSLETLLPK